jgi:hypothetical protein
LPHQFSFMSRCLYAERELLYVGNIAKYSLGLMKRNIEFGFLSSQPLELVTYCTVDLRFDTY